MHRVLCAQQSNATQCAVDSLARRAPEHLRPIRAPQPRPPPFFGKPKNFSAF